jgi:exopolyphosphatase/guanosine-5'-triphosphate,3'-diphosphate pyrophosphatase
MIRKAIIDLGTNTFNLLIADVGNGGFQLVHSEKEGVALGMGGINNNFITPDAVNRAIASLIHFLNVCKQYRVEKLIAIGTSAIRDASNAQAFIDEVQKQTDLQIQVVSGIQEAELIYQGVKWSYSFNESATIMDIGGGSTEFVFATKNGICDLVSLNIGVSRIYQYFNCSDPFSSADVRSIIEWLEYHSHGFFDDKKAHILIGASGSFETFYELTHACTFPSNQQAIEIPFESLCNSLNQIIYSTQQERNQNDWIIPIRKKMAPIAAIKTQWILNKLHVKRVYVSPYSLKEGALSL